MKKANIVNPNKRSFLELSTKEIDDYDEDDQELTKNSQENSKNKNEYKIPNETESPDFRSNKIGKNKKNNRYKENKQSETSGQNEESEHSESIGQIEEKDQKEGVEQIEENEQSESIEQKEENEQSESIEQKEDNENNRNNEQKEENEQNEPIIQNYQIETSSEKKDEKIEDDLNINFLETKLQTKNPKDLIVNKPKNKSKLDIQKAKIFRNSQMENLQNTHTFTQSEREDINEKYSKGSASFGKQFADEFVTFLGFLRDASSHASNRLSRKEGLKLAKLIKASDGDDKNKKLHAPSPKAHSKGDKLKKRNAYVPTSSLQYS